MRKANKDGAVIGAFASNAFFKLWSAMLKAIKDGAVIVALVSNA